MIGFDMVIRGGTVVTAADAVICDVGIKDGTIDSLGRNLGPGQREIDATGRLVLPGGIDSHCHLEQHSPQGLDTADDFHSGTIAAAFGGNTTVIPFAIQLKGQRLREVLENYLALAESKAIVDYAFHLILSDPTEEVLAHGLEDAFRFGCTSWKIFTIFAASRLDDAQILDVLTVARREGALVMFHAENHDAVAWQTARLLESGHTAPRYHEASRPMAVEREAVHRVLTLAELVDVPVLIVHVSGGEALEQILAARARGQQVFAETCTHYLLLSSDDLDRPGLEGAKYMCSPPPRARANQLRIWRGIVDGDFEIFSSDHSPYRFDDVDGKMRHGPNPTFQQIANGMPGLELRLPLLFSFGVGEGRISLERFVALTATNAGKIYGLYPRKGTLAVGSDADIAIWDPEREVTITQAMLHGNVDYTPFEGVTVRGWPQTVISRGEVLVEDGMLQADRGRGRFLPCGPPATRRL